MQGLAGAAVSLAGAPRSVFSSGLQSSPAQRAQALSVLTGPQVDLTVDSRIVNFTGAPRMATVVNERIPAPLLYWREGDEVRVRVTNRLAVPTSIHWHGLLVPAAMDGVPGISFGGIPAGGTFEYRFRLRQSGSYWYHSHSRFQEQIGLYGPIVIAPAGSSPHRADREHVLLLSDWTDADPEHVYRALKLQSDYFNYNQPTVADFFDDVRRRGFARASAEHRMWGSMRMNPTDLLDVSGHTYTYLLNGNPPAANWTGLFRRGERVRLRIINGSSMSFFDFRIPGLPMTVVAADGQEIEPVTVDEFRIGAAEVYDVIVEPKDDRAYALFAQSMDRTGYARGTLAPAPGMESEIPPLDARPILSLADIGMGAMSGAQDRHPEMPEMPDMPAMPGMPDMPDMPGMHGMASPARFGPNVDMAVAQPANSLENPGAGLRDNGRRVLRYADLHTIGGPIDSREPAREIRLHLTGHMQRYVWSFDGQKFSESAPLRFTHGERLRVVLVNDTMMNHPIHLHGMWSEVESPQARFQVRKHTVVVQPGQQLSYAVSADAPGSWAYHCHLLYHMEAGMFREVSVEGSPSAPVTQ